MKKKNRKNYSEKKVDVIIKEITLCLEKQYPEKVKEFENLLKLMGKKDLFIKTNKGMMEMIRIFEDFKATIYTVFKIVKKEIESGVKRK